MGVNQIKNVNSLETICNVMLVDNEI